MRRGDFYGHKTIILENESIQLECLAEVGPRIVRLIPAWIGENLFTEVPNDVTTTSFGAFHFWGGHRLWYAPEAMPRTYLPDDKGLAVKNILNGIQLTGEAEPETGIRKSVSIQISPSRPFVMVRHQLENQGPLAIRLAPWAITMMRTKGIAVLPQQFGSVDKFALLPNRRVALWSYSRWSDPRLRLDEEFVTVRSDKTSQPFKLGYFNPHGWLGYAFEDAFFVKRFGVRRDEAYPDYGCNSEVYTNDKTIELESLGSLVNLQPHEKVTHTETWEIYRDTEVPKELLGGRSLKQVIGQALLMQFRS